jgi:DNA adenine methylase
LEQSNHRPFLSWAGGKRRLVRHLQPYLPTEFGTYWELFLGAGALFFATSPPSAHLSDLNADLISCFRCVRSKPALVSRYLSQHKALHCERHYDSVRSDFGRSRPSAAQAARFIYLNKACFNAIYRVNKSGLFNVPFGYKASPSLPSPLQLREAGEALSAATLHAGSYDEVLAKFKPSTGDFLYLDPPYPPLNSTSNFRHYTASRFSLEDHKRLSEVAHELSRDGCSVLVSNADVEQIRSLYRDWHTVSLPVRRWVAANGTRHTVNELLITNYRIPRRK